MGRKVLTGAAAMEIKRLYSLLSSTGKPLHSQMEIARIVGVSETTVFRVIHKGGAYAQVRELPTEDEAEASLKRFKEVNRHLFSEEEMGETVLGKLQAAIRETQEKSQAGDKMLEELNEEDFMKGSGV